MHLVVGLREEQGEDGAQRKVMGVLLIINVLFKEYSIY